MSEPGFSRFDLEKRVRNIAASIDCGGLDEAKDLSAALEAFSPATLSEVRTAGKILGQLGKSGWHEVLLERYMRSNPEDREARLYQIEIKIANRTDVAALLDAFEPNSVDEMVKKGKLYSKAGLSNRAISAFEAAIRQQPENVDALRGAAEIFNWKNSRVEARKLLRRLVKVMPNEAAWWAFAAEHAGRAEDDILFEEAIRRISSSGFKLQDHDKAKLAIGYSFRGDSGNVRDIIRGFILRDIESSWLLSELLILATKFVLLDEMLDLSRRLIEIGDHDASGFDLAERVLAHTKNLGRSSLWMLSPVQSTKKKPA